MTPEQKRIRALESTVLDLVAALEKARIGFGSRLADDIRHQISLNREAHKFPVSKPKAPPSTPPAAPVESETAP